MKLKGTTIGAIESVAMTNVPLAALAKEYRLALASKASYIDGAGNSYVGSRLLIQFLLSEQCKMIDKATQHKLDMVQQAKLQDSGDSDYKEDNFKYKDIHD